ncbi:class F sortase [Spirillospora sp. NBC_01491]|uniref:class F sortase n=1 Tax=Spirillospora sp. NBC_01491 TaxID=2976007 RepID=UPI002E33614E|nr:class F sortase [Spirillospora sp. NBC_01491]
MAIVTIATSGLAMTALFAVQAFGNHTAATTAPQPGPAASNPESAHLTVAMPRSTPVRLTVPRIRLRTSLVPLGLTDDHRVEVPVNADQAGWYRLGSRPGSIGAAVLIGHVDSSRGPGVFFRIGELRPGDKAGVQRADGSTALFQIDSVERVKKTGFPTRRVYMDPGYAAIRLVTCGGGFDTDTGHYTDNVIAYGHLLRPGSHRSEEHSMRPLAGP